MTEKLNITRIFNAIWDLYKDHAGILLTTALVIYLGAAIVVGLFILVSPIHANQSRPTVGTLFSAIGPKLGTLIGAGLLAGIGITIGLILLIVPGLYLLTIWAVIAPVIIIEGARVTESFGRSQQLVRGNGWAVFGTVAIIAFLSSAIGQFIRIIVGGDSFVGGMLGTLIPGIILAPVGALAAAVLYFELVRVKEGGVAAAAPIPSAAAPTPAGTQPPPPPQ